MSTTVRDYYHVLDFTGNKTPGSMFGLPRDICVRFAKHTASVRKEVFRVVPMGKDVYAADDGEAFYPVGAS